MSSRTLRQWVLRTTKDSSRAAILASPRRTGISLDSTLTSYPSLINQSGTSPLQTRFFHPTATRRLFESSAAIVTACLGVASAGLLAMFLRKHVVVVVHRGGPRPKFVPPIAWVQAADKKTREEVKTIITAGFQMASQTPIRQRDQAFREASFQVPYEIARLNPDASRFRLEDMGSLSSLREDWKRWAKLDVHLKSPLNIERDARIFLYFPNDSAEATAVFMAVNAEFAPPGKWQASATPNDNARLISVAMNIWACQIASWGARNRDTLHRIGPTHLPLIISFRGVACGAIWDVPNCRALDNGSLTAVLDFIERDI